jgi:hypothetical protein
MTTKLIVLSLLSCAFVFNSFGLRAQNNDEEKVLSTVKQLFLAMKTNDSAMAASLFTESAMLHTVFENNEGITEIRSSPVSRLTSAFAATKEQTWYEPVWNEKVQISDGLASVWVDYAFYLDSSFSHCGVDAFHLVKLNGSWKIFHLADTRRKTGCNIPEHIQKRFETKEG